MKTRLLKMCGPNLGCLIAVLRMTRKGCKAGQIFAHRSPYTDDFNTPALILPFLKVFPLNFQNLKNKSVK